MWHLNVNPNYLTRFNDKFNGIISLKVPGHINVTDTKSILLDAAEFYSQRVSNIDLELSAGIIFMGNKWDYFFTKRS